MEIAAIKEISPAQVRQTAIRLLARREHSYLELQQKLQQRGFPLPIIKQQLDLLVSKDLLSDKRFIESYIRARSQKNYGPTRIIAELQQRGIKAELIEHHLASLEDEWPKLAEQVRQKRFGKKLPKNFTEKAIQMRFLQYRGFTNAQIKRVINLKQDETN